jgi:hypothetical protein
VEKPTLALIETPLQLRRASAPRPPALLKNDFAVHGFVNPFLSPALIETPLQLRLASAPRLRAQTACPSKKMILLSMVLSTLSPSPALIETPLQGERLGSHKQPLQEFKIKFAKSRLFRKIATRIYGCFAFFKTTCW